MAPRHRIPETLRHRVRRRAEARCEYCHAAEQWQYVRFTVDHVIPVAHGGSTTDDNLALACFHCNRRKADKMTVSDPVSGEDVPLFHPRQDSWNDHFIWSADGLSIIGLTSTGRATVEALALNRTWVITIREADRAVGRHPPSGDQIQQRSESSASDR